MVFQWFVFSRSAGQIRTWGASGCLSNWLFSTCLLVPWFRSLSQWNAWTMVLWSLNTKAKDVYKYILWDRNGDILGWAVGRLYGFKIAVFTHCCIEFVVESKNVSVFLFSLHFPPFSLKLPWLSLESFPWVLQSWLICWSVISSGSEAPIFERPDRSYPIFGHHSSGDWGWERELQMDASWQAMNLECVLVCLGGCEQTKRNNIPRPFFLIEIM